MPRQFTTLPIRGFGTLVSNKDTVDVGAGGLVTATNALLRPANAVKGPIFYERLWLMGEDQATTTCTVAGDTFTKSTHALVVGAVLRFTTTGTLPTGLTANTDFYIESIPTADTFKVTATLGGSAITTSGGSGTLSYIATITVQALYRSLQYSRILGYVDFDVDDKVFIEAHGLAVNDIVQFTTTDTLPAGLSLATDYYIKAVPSSDSFTLSTSLGGALLDITDAGTGIHTLTLSAGVGSTSSLRSRFRTVAARHWRQGKSFVALYDLVNDKGRGVFYMGDDGTFSGAYGFTSGTPSSEVLAVALDSDAMWFGSRVAGLLMIQNGVDDPVAVQLDRTKVPGKWRKCGDNVAPSAPVLALIAPETSANIQASGMLFPGKDLVFTVVDFATHDTISISGIISTGTNLQAAGSSGTLPAGIIGAALYYAYDCVYTRSTNTTVLKLSTTDPVNYSPTPVDITDAGTGTHYFFRTGTWTGAATPLTLTVNEDWLNGSAGNEVFIANIESHAEDTLSSTLTGTGTTVDPYVYTLALPATGASLTAIVAFINADSKVLTFVTAAGADDGLLYAAGPVLLANGTGTGISTGFTNRTVTIYLRYFDTGTSSFGYEGASSTLSEEHYITETAHNDVLVTITPNPSAGGGRFDKIRVYMQFGEGAEAIWSLMGDVDNIDYIAGTTSLQIGTATVIGQGLSEFDQNRPLPHKAVVAASSRTWRGAVRTAGFRNRLYISKEATDDEPAPEGVGLAAYEIIDVPEATSKIEIRALFSDLYRLHVHTNSGIMIIDPGDVENTPHKPAVQTGAINPSCFGSGNGNDIIYIGQDIQPYVFNGNRYGNRNVKSAAKDAIALIRNFANVDTIGQNADLVTCFQDKNGLLWWFFPNDSGTIISVCLDLEAAGLMGYYDYPRTVSACQMEPERPEILMQDVSGNLFIYDITAQLDSGADLPAVATFTPTSTSITPTAGNNGYGYVDYNSLRYPKAAWTTIETGHMDLGVDSKLKAFNGISFRPVANSRGIVIVTLTGITSGLAVTRTFGEMGEFGDIGPKRMFISLNDSAASLKMEILGAQGKPWIIRDAALLFRG